VTEILTFERALEASEKIDGNRHLLLGNGFSIACRDSFSYGKLFDEADFSDLTIDAGPLFEIFGTADFERAIDALRVSAAILDLYECSEGETVERLRRDAETLKEALAQVLARKHPDNVNEIGREEYASARRFLANFDGGRIFTVNYDLLLYWTLLQDLEPRFRTDDGFRDPDDPDADYVIWDGYESEGQRIYHLHGGLHLYDAGSWLKKITWKRTGIPLVDQIRDALASNVYPHVVTEGSSEQKLARIEHSPYLHRGLKSLTRCGGKLFIHGHSLDENDEHVLARIESSKVEAAFISLHGDPVSSGNRKIRERAELMSIGALRMKSQNRRPEGSTSKSTSMMPTALRFGPAHS
jgi:Domain of unknown function (DUF4917)